jgi:hypothetical protein
MNKGSLEFEKKRFTAPFSRVYWANLAAEKRCGSAVFGLGRDWALNGELIPFLN